MNLSEGTCNSWDQYPVVRLQIPNVDKALLTKDCAFGTKTDGRPMKSLNFVKLVAT